jgi:hypothetical protein
MTLAPPDVEKAFVAYLNGLLTPQVSTRVPATRPASFVRVQVVGGDVLNVALDAPRLLVECWAATDGAAFALARQAWAAVSETRAAWVGDVWVSALTLSRPVNFPDPDTASPRFQFTVDLRVAMTPA